MGAMDYPSKESQGQMDSFAQDSYGGAQVVDTLDGNSKTNDPISSVEAGEDSVLSGTVANHQTIIQKVLTTSPLTNMMIAHLTGLNQAQVARRMIELERRGMTKRGELMICPILKRNVGSWLLGDVRD